MIFRGLARRRPGPSREITGPPLFSNGTANGLSTRGQESAINLWKTCSCTMTTVHTTSTSSGSSGAATSIARFGATEGSLADQGFLCQYRHKAPIALNNQAVSLLARGYNQEALVIFQDAIAVMRSVTAMMDPNHASTPAAIGKAAIHAALRRAEQRMVASTFGSTTSSGEPVWTVPLESTMP
jgi:hypothetical protein